MGGKHGFWGHRGFSLLPGMPRVIGTGSVDIIKTSFEPLVKVSVDIIKASRAPLAKVTVDTTKHYQYLICTVVNVALAVRFCCLLPPTICVLSCQFVSPDGDAVENNSEAYQVNIHPKIEDDVIVVLEINQDRIASLRRRCAEINSVRTIGRTHFYTLV